MAQDGIRVTFSCQPTETALPRTQTPEYLTRGVPQVEDCPQYVLCCKPATSAQPTFQFKLPYIGYRKSKGIIALSQQRAQLPSEWCREVKSDQCYLRDRQSGKAPSHLSAMSVPHSPPLRTPPISSVEKQIFKRGSSLLSINGSSFMIPFPSSQEIRTTIKPSKNSSEAGKPVNLKTDFMQSGETLFSSDSITFLTSFFFKVLCSNTRGRRTATRCGR